MIDLQTDIKFLVFTGLTDSRIEGLKISYQMSLIKEVITRTADDNLVIVSVDDTTAQYNFREVLDPGTGSAFVSLQVFETYVIAAINA